MVRLLLRALLSPCRHTGWGAPLDKKCLRSSCSSRWLRFLELRAGASALSFLRLYPGSLVQIAGSVGQDIPLMLETLDSSPSYSSSSPTKWNEMCYPAAPGHFEQWLLYLLPLQGSLNLLVDRQEGPLPPTVVLAT